MTDKPTPNGNERRRRLARPRALMIFGALFCAMPLFNYLGFVHQYQLTWHLPQRVLPNLPLAALVMMIAAPIVGAGLLRVQKWGWYALLAYAGTLISYDFYVLARSPVLYNYLALLNTLPALAAAIYFIRPDIAAPYMRMYPRGWRFHRREPLQITVTTDGRQHETRDFGAGGFYADWPACPYRPGDSAAVFFELNGRQYETTGGVVRVDPDGVGIAFRGLDRDTRREIAREAARAQRTPPAPIASELPAQVAGEA